MTLTEADYFRTLLDMNNERVTKLELRICKLEEELKIALDLLRYGPHP